MDENLKKEVMALKSQGYTETQIKQFLTQKGYPLNSISEAISEIVKEHNNQAKPKGKKIIISSIIILIILLSILIYYFIQKNNTEITEIPPSEYAGDWIEKMNETSTINIDEATKGMSNYDFGRQTFIDNDGEIYAIFTNSYYEGKNTKWIEETTGEITILQNKNMNSNDNIPEGFAMLKKEDGDFVLYIFLDNDWKNKYGSETYVVWSDNIMNDASIKESVFDFSNQNQGIYFNRLTNMSWITENVVDGRVYFGNLRKENVIKNDFNKTFFEIS